MRNSRILKSWLPLCALPMTLLCGGCGWLGSASVNHEPTPSAAAPASSPESGKLPLALRIIDEVNDGGVLHVRAGVRSEVPWPSEQVMVVLTTASSGEQRKVHTFPLTGLLRQSSPLGDGSEVLMPGSESTFVLKAPLSGATDYQLELRWGREVARHHQSPVQQLAPKLEVRNVTLTAVHAGCAAPPCSSSIQIDGYLFNSGVVPVESAILGIGFVWVPKGQTGRGAGPDPESEDTVELTNLALQPGKLRPLRFMVEGDAPSSTLGKLRPVLRVISVNGTELDRG